jgi:hypothetical protein
MPSEGHMRLRLTALLFAFAMTGIPAVCQAKPGPQCKVTFEVAYLDRLNNMNRGVPPKSVKDVEKKLSKYGDVCYAGNSIADLVFFIHTMPAKYHGTRVYHDSSTATAGASDGNGGSAAASASTTSTTAVPYTVDYSVFILDIEAQQPNGSFKILRTLDQKGLYHTMYGIGYGKGKHPITNVIDAGARWLHENFDSARLQPPAQVVTVANPSTSEPVHGTTSLDISSNPSGAEITLDGNFVGDTPSTIEVKAGDHAISVKKNGYQVWEKKLKTSSGNVKIAAELEAEQKN